MQPQNDNDQRSTLATLESAPPPDFVATEAQLGVAQQLPEMTESDRIDANVVTDAQRPRNVRLLTGRIGLGTLLLLVLVGGILALRYKGKPAPLQAGDFATVQLPLTALAASDQGSAANQEIIINGKLSVKGSVVLTPSAQPLNVQTGQIYYDKTSDKLNYYNGAQFIALGGGDTTNTTVQNNSTINNNSTTTVNGALNAVTSPGGTPGTIAKFTGNQTLGNSIITDDGNNVTVAGNLNLVNLTPGTQMTIWPTNATPTVDDYLDPLAVEVGVKFQSDIDGTVQGIRFYKGPLNTGTHIGDLWTSSGTNLATATFTNESATGWQTVFFAHPIAVSAGVTYVASYHTTVGEYAADQHYFSFNGVDNPPIHALQDGADGSNGVYHYGAVSVFPTDSSGSGTNYWVDVYFTPSATPNFFEINGAPISSSSLSNNYDIAKRSSGNVFTGANTFRNTVNTVNAFVIQDAASNPLFVADTTTSSIVISQLTIARDLRLDGHFITQGNTPTIAAGPAACTTPTATVVGSDTAGMIDITTGTGCVGTGKLATLTYNAVYAFAPRVLLTPANANAAGLTAYIDSATISTTAFDLQISAGTIANTTDYRWYYQVLQ